MKKANEGEEISIKIHTFIARVEQKPFSAFFLSRERLFVCGGEGGGEERKDNRNLSYVYMRKRGRIGTFL